MVWRSAIVTLMFMGGVSSPLFANDLNAVQTLIHTGEYESARKAAIEIRTAEALALAAECLARQVMLGEVDKLKKASKQARDLAKDALEIDPNHQNARLQYVVADGFVARLTGDVSAWMKKLPQKSFAKIESYRTDFPDDPRGDALLAAWHLTVVRKAGEDNAKKWFQASIAEGQTYYETALAASPDDPVILLNYAFGLAALDEKEFSDWDKIKELLERVVAINSNDDLTQKIVIHARNALERFEDKEVLKDYAEGFLEGELTTT